MRYFVYRRYIKVFRYIRNHDNDKISEVEGKFGKRGEEALSILESRGGIINKFTFWDKSNCVIDNIISEYKDKKNQTFWTAISIIISIFALGATIYNLIINS